MWLIRVVLRRRSRLRDMGKGKLASMSHALRPALLELQRAVPPGSNSLLKGLGYRTVSEAPLFRGMWTESSGVSELRLCARTNLKKGLVPYLPVWRGSQQIQLASLAQTNQQCFSGQHGWAHVCFWFGSQGCMMRVPWKPSIRDTRPKLTYFSILRVPSPSTSTRRG